MDSEGSCHEAALPTPSLGSFKLLREKLIKHLSTNFTGEYLGNNPRLEGKWNVTRQNTSKSTRDVRNVLE